MPFSDIFSHAVSRRRLLTAATLFGGSVCLVPTALRAETRGPVRSMLELRRENTVVQEWDLSCGAATLATVLRFQHGDHVTERDLVRQLINRDIYIANPELVQIRQGFSLSDLKRVVERRGYTGIGYGDLDLSDALEIAPVITPIRAKGYNHFVVLLGLVGDTVQMADPSFGNRTMSVARFRRIWMEFPGLGHVGFVVARGDDPAAPGRLRPDPRVFMTPPPAMIRNSIN